MKAGDLEHLKDWYAISCPVRGLRFDARTLELLDTDGDGHIRTPEVLAAVKFLEAKGVSVESLSTPDAGDSARLADVLARQADLEKEEPSDLEKAAQTEWEARGEQPAAAVLGSATAAAEAALAAVENLVDAYFMPPEDLPLVTEQDDVVLPLTSKINPRHQEAIRLFAETCVKPILGAREVLTRADWLAVKARFAPYRAWRAAKPVVRADAKSALESEERLLRYRMHLGEFLENYVSMRRLYSREQTVFQAGTLRIDGREMSLCLDVADEAAHAALVAKSNCCVIYLRLTRPAEAASRTLCAVVTAGRVATLYVGRNGVFYDRDGKDWEAVVTKVVENQVSLVEAFWAPWRKLANGFGDLVKKFLGDRQTKALSTVAPVQGAQAGGAALASSVAAVGIGVGMVGAAAASVISAIKGLQPWWMVFVALAALVLLVSLPSMILTWFRLRARDLGVVLNACGWAINRPIRLSMRLARQFTRTRGLF